MNKRVFFIVQNNSELLVSKGFISNLKDSIDEFNIFLIKSSRLKNEEVKKVSSNITKINFIPYTKNFLKILKLKRQLLKVIHNLNITKNDILFSPSLHDLANIILFKKFKEINAKTIIYSFNGTNFKGKNYAIDIKKTIEYSLSTIVASRVICIIYRYKDTVFRTPFVKLYPSALIDIGISKIKNAIPHENYFRINSLYNNLNNIDYGRAQINKKKIVLFINTNKHMELTGLSLDKYLIKLKEVIFILKNKNYKIIVKDHPSSILKDNEIKKKLDIKRSEHLSKNENSEFYLLNNFKNILLVLSAPSNLLLTCNLLSINSYIIKDIYEIKSEIYNKLNLINLNELNDLKLIKDEASSSNKNKFYKDFKRLEKIKNFIIK